MNNLWLEKDDRIVIKVWSNIISCSNNHINIDNLRSIVKWIEYLMQQWLNVLLVSSWAISVWKSIYNNWMLDNIGINDETIKKAQFSRLWWHALLSMYKSLFDWRLVIDSLLTHKNFSEEVNLLIYIN